VAKAFAIKRREKRIPMSLAVQISGNEAHAGVETTFTENVSSQGARVVSIRRWETNDRMTFASLPGDFLTVARVAYCQPLRGEGFAVGLEFLEPAGRWVIHRPPVQEIR
jgi:hypothetical protein